MNIPALGLLVSFMIMTTAVLREVGVVPRQSLSQHIAKSPRTIAYGKVGLTLGGVLLFLSLATYFYLGAWFVTLVIIAACMGCATAYLPYNVSRKQNLWHDVFSYGYVVCNPVILAIVWRTLPQDGVSYAYLIGIGFQVAIIGLLIFVRRARKYFLYGQLAFLCVFASLLIVV